MAMREARYWSRPAKPVGGITGADCCWANPETDNSTIDMKRVIRQSRFEGISFLDRKAYSSKHRFKKGQAILRLTICCGGFDCYALRDYFCHYGNREDCSRPRCSCGTAVTKAL